MKKFNEKLSKFCKEKNNRLCLGLDIDNSKLKNSSLKYLKDYIVGFQKNITLVLSRHLQYPH